MMNFNQTALSYFYRIANDALTHLGSENNQLLIIPVDDSITPVASVLGGCVEKNSFIDKKTAIGIIFVNQKK